MEKDPIEYDDEKAIAFIRNQVPQEMKEKLADDDVCYYLLDCIYDYYESKGYLNEESDDEVDVDIDDLTAFVVKAAKKENLKLTPEEIGFFVDAEIGYCDQLGVFVD